MGNVSKIYIEVAVDGKGGIKVLRQIGTESDKTGKKGKKSFHNMSRSAGDFNKQIGLTRKLIGGMGALFAGWGLSRIIGSMAQMVKVGEEQRKAVAGMETAMRSMGRYTPQMSEALQDYAAILQQVTNYGDEATMMGIKFLMTFNKITDELMFRSIKTMQDMAALMGGDMRQAANTLGKASMGMVGDLTRLGITIEKGTYKAEGYLGMLKAIETQVSGQAAAMRDPWIQLANAIEDAKEPLGGFIGLAFEDYAKDMIRLLPELSKSWKELAASIKETHRVELEYMIQSLEAQLAGKGMVADLPGTMAPDFTIFGMTGEEEKALQEKLERYKGFLEELKKASDETIKTTVPEPDARALKDHKALMTEVEKAEKQFRDALIIPSGTYETMEQQLRRGVADNLKIMVQEVEEQFTILDNLSQRTAEAMEQNFSDFYFDVMRGEFDDLGDYADAMLMSIQRATADVMGQMTKEALFGKGSGGGGLIQGIGKWIATSLFHGGGEVGRTPVPARAVPAPLFYNAPRLHRGLAGDEFPAILQKGETVYAKGSGPVIQVNVNNHGEPLEQTEPPEVRFDGQKYIADVHIDKMINSRSYRQANRQALR